MKDIFKDIKILVVGDSCTDVFTYGHVLRLAPEGPAPVFNPIYTTSNGGMALNVAANISAIGAKVKLITQSENITKTRYIDERTNSLLLRIDDNDKSSKISNNILKSLIDNEYQGIKYDAIIVSDYCKGFLSEEDIEVIATRNSNVFLDTKKILGKWCNDINFIKINHTEYDKTKHTIDFLGLYEKMIITRSDDGCEYNHILYPVEKVNIKDVSGAGDTFISGLVCEFIRTKDVIQAIKYAQECATQVVQKKGVCTI
jgi:D-beta-D-heptose 7-phosphate kinase/D-beta-D-heptose 1-phosphate adenosyltransferase